MTEPLVYIDCSEIRDGKLAEVKEAMKELAEFVDRNEPQLISYEFYLSQDGKRMTVVAIHPDAASLEYHMEIGKAAFRRFADLINLTGIDVYGTLGDSALDQLQKKAQMLGDGTVAIHQKHAGFARFRSPVSRPITTSAPERKADIKPESRN